MGLTDWGKKLALARIGVNYNKDLDFLDSDFGGWSIKNINFWSKLQTAVGEVVEIKDIVNCKLIYRKLVGDEKIYDIIMIVGWYLNHKKSWVIFYNTSDDKMELWNEFSYNNPFRNGNKVSINRIYDFGQSEETGNLYFLTETFERNPQIFGDINNPPEHIFQVILLNGNENDKQFLTLISCVNPNNYLPEEKLELEINKIVELTNVDETQNLEMSKALHRINEIEDNKYLVAIWNKSSDVEFGACNIWPVKYEDAVNETEIGYNVPSNGNPYRGKKQKGTPIQSHSNFSKKVSPHTDWTNPLSNFNIKGFSIGETSDGFIWLGKQLDDFQAFRFELPKKYIATYKIHKALPPDSQIIFVSDPITKNQYYTIDNVNNLSVRYIPFYYFSDYDNIRGFPATSITNEKIEWNKQNQINNRFDQINENISILHYYIFIEQTYREVITREVVGEGGDHIYRDVTQNTRISLMVAWQLQNSFEMIIKTTEEELSREEDVFIDITMFFEHDNYGEASKGSDWSSDFIDDFQYGKIGYSGNYSTKFTIKCNIQNPSSGYIELEKKGGEGSIYFGSDDNEIYNEIHKKRLKYEVQAKKFNNGNLLLSLKLNYLIPQLVSITKSWNRGKLESVIKNWYAGWENLNIKFSVNKLYWRPSLNYVKNIYKDDSNGSNAKIPIVKDLLENFTSPDFLLSPMIKNQNDIKLVYYKNNNLILEEQILSKPSQDSTQPSTWNKNIIFNQNYNLKDAQLLAHDKDFKILAISDIGLLYFSNNKLYNIYYNFNENYFNLFVNNDHLLSSWIISSNNIKLFQIIDEPKILNLQFNYDYNDDNLNINRVEVTTNNIIINASQTDTSNFINDSLNVYVNFQNNFFYDYNTINKIQMFGSQGIPILEDQINYQKELFNNFVYNYQYSIDVEGINFEFTSDAKNEINRRILRDDWVPKTWILKSNGVTHNASVSINEEQNELIIDTTVFPVDADVELFLDDELIGTFKNKTSIKIYWRK